MMPMIARTSFVQERIENRPAGPDSFIEDLLKIERSLAEAGPRGVAATRAFLNLMSRYPRESEAIARELGTSPLPYPASDRLDEIVDDCLRLAEERLLSEKHHAGEFGGFA
ncbi:MAG: hypothetical protein AABX36_04550 [Candidatus Thermoplasmatota archaeon]|jgi:hypothetical protein